MDSQENAANVAEATPGRGTTAVKPSPQILPGFQVRPQGPSGPPRQPLSNGPLGPRPGGQPPQIRRLDSRSSLGPPGTVQFPQPRPYGPPRQPGIAFSPRLIQCGANSSQNPAIILNPRFIQQGPRGPGPQQGIRGPYPGNYPGQQAQRLIIVQRPPQPGIEQSINQNALRAQALDSPASRPVGQEAITARTPQRNDSLLSLPRQTPQSNEEALKHPPTRPRIVVEKMDVDSSSDKLQLMEDFAQKKKTDHRENSENDDDDDVVVDGEKSRTNGDASLDRAPSTPDPKSPQVLKKNGEVLQNASKPETGNVGAKTTSLMSESNMEKKEEKVENVSSKPASGTVEGKQAESVKESTSIDDRPASAKVEVKEPKDPMDALPVGEKERKIDQVPEKSPLKAEEKTPVKDKKDVTKEEKAEEKAKLTPTPDTIDTATKDDGKLEKLEVAAAISGSDETPSDKISKTPTKSPVKSTSHATPDILKEEKPELNLPSKSPQRLSPSTVAEIHSEPKEEEKTESLAKSPEKSPLSLPKSPDKPSLPKSPDKSQLSPQKAPDELQPSPQKTPEKLQPSSEKVSDKLQPSPQKTPEKLQPSSEKVSDKLQPSPEKTPEKLQPSPEKTPEKLQPSSEKVSDKLQPTPEKTPEKLQPSPEQTSDKLQPSPQKTPEKLQPSPEKTLDKLQPSPEKTPEKLETTLVSSPDKSHISPQKSPDILQPSPQKSPDKSQPSPQKSQEPAQSSPAKSEDASKEEKLNIPEEPETQPSTPEKSAKTNADLDEPEPEKPSENPHRDKSDEITAEANKDEPDSAPVIISPEPETLEKAEKSPNKLPIQKPELLPPKSPEEGVKGFDNGQRRSLSPRSPGYSPQSPASPKSPKTPDSVKQMDTGEKKKTTFAEDVASKTEEEGDDKKASDSSTKSSRPSGGRIQRTQTPANLDPERKKAPKSDTYTYNGSESNGSCNMAPHTNGVGDSPTKKSPSKSRESDKRSTAGSPVKSPSKSAKSLPRTPETPTSTSSQDKKKVPMNKVQVGAAPSPNLKTVRSKIGSLDNASYKPGGGNVKIENRKLDFSKAQPKIAAKNDKYTPSGGDKKISQVKLQWNAKSKIGSLDNATYKPGGGDKKIETVKLDFKDKAKPKVGSMDNAKHVPGGGTVKSSSTPPKTPQETSNDIATEKLDIKAESKVGSMDNMKHKPGGGDKKIFDDKDYLRQTSSNVESLSGSGTQVGTPVEETSVPTARTGKDTSPQPPPSTPTKTKSVSSPTAPVTAKAVRNSLAKSPEATGPRKTIISPAESQQTNEPNKKSPSAEAVENRSAGKDKVKSPTSPRPPNSLRLKSPEKSSPGTSRKSSPRGVKLPKLLASPVAQETTPNTNSPPKICLPKLIEPTSQSTRVAH